MVAARVAPAVGGVENLLRDVAGELAREHEVAIVSVRNDDAPWTRLGDSIDVPGAFAPYVDRGVRVTALRAPRNRRVLHQAQRLQTLRVSRRFAFGRMRHGLHWSYAAATSGGAVAAMPDADVVHAWSPDLPAAAGLRAARSLGVPFVVSPFVHPNQWGDGVASRRLFRRADRVIALLDVDAAFHRSVGVRPERIAVIGSASDGVSPGGGPGLRRERGIPGPLVVFLGARRAYKGVDLLLAAAPAVEAAVPGTTFAFVGPGDPLPLIDGVRLIDAGRVGEAERAAWLDAADLLCLPSEAEIFPLSVLESWSVGTPVVVSDIPPLRELVERTGGGVAAGRTPEAMARAVAELLADGSRRARLGEAGRAAWRSRYTTAAIAARHAEVYAAVCAEARPSVRR